MGSADAAGLVATGTGDVVQPPLEPADRADVLQFDAVSRRLPQRRHDVGLSEYGIGNGPLALHQAELRLQLGRIEAGRRRRNRAMREEFFRDHGGAAIELGEVPGIEQPCLELAFQTVVGQNAVAVDLVFHRRFPEQVRLRIIAKHFQEIIGAEIAHRRFRRMRDLKIGFDAIDVGIADQVERAVLCQ